MRPRLVAAGVRPFLLVVRFGAEPLFPAAGAPRVNRFGVEPSPPQRCPGVSRTRTTSVPWPFRPAGACARPPPAAETQAGVRLTFSIEVEIVGAAARKRVHPLDAGGTQSHGRGGPLPGALGRGVALALPRDQPAADRQQGSRVLGQHRERGKRPGQHGVVGLPWLAAGPVLRPRVHDPDALEPQPPRRDLHELAFAAHGLDQVECHARARDRQRQSRKPRAAADVRHARHPDATDSDHVQVGQRAEAVRDVHEGGLGWIAYGGGCTRIVVHQRQQGG